MHSNLKLSYLDRRKVTRKTVGVIFTEVVQGNTDMFHLDGIKIAKYIRATQIYLISSLSRKTGLVSELILCCKRYTCLVHAQIGPDPLWLEEHLHSVSLIQ